MTDRLFDQLKIHAAQSDTSAQRRLRLPSVELPPVELPTEPPVPQPSAALLRTSPEPSAPESLAPELFAPEPSAPKPPAPQPSASVLVPAPRRPTVQPHPRKRKPRQPSRWAPVAWSKVWLTLLMVCGGVFAGGFLLLISLPPLPDCRKSTTILPDTQQLYCAREAARSGDLPSIASALKLVATWPEGHPLHDETQHLVEDWSNALLHAAYQKMDHSDLAGAVALAQQIPAVSPVYAEAQEAIASWNAEWKSGNAIYAEAQGALQRREWGAASAYVLDLGNMEHAYWREQRSNQLTQQVIAEKEAWQAFRKAETLAKAKTPDKLGEAIASIETIPSTLMIWPTIEPKLNQWSQEVVSAALKQWQRGNRSRAVALVKPVPPRLVQDANLRGLVYLSQAQQLAEQTQAMETPVLQRMYALMEALSAMRQIAPDSLFYEQAQENMALWQAQLDDLNQLQRASLLASVGQRQTFEAAIAAAQMITPDRPLRLQAQTLIADWRQQLLRIEDMPKLRWAERLAAPGTIKALQLAIASAQTIPPDRPITAEAQTAIAQWQDQIEAIEDRPILDAAEALAKADKLKEAIDQASKIQRGRELYDPAQAAIATWKAKIQQIQIAEDQPILDEAVALAARERLTMAIEKASQIAPGRALYPQAQAAIDQWVSDRAAIWNQWDSEQPATPDEWSADDGTAAPSDPNFPQ